MVKNCYEGCKWCKYIHILFTTNIIREEKTLWLKEQNAAKWIHGATEIKLHTPFPGPTGSTSSPFDIWFNALLLCEYSRYNILNCYSRRQLMSWNIRFNLVTAPSLFVLHYFCNVQLWAFPWTFGWTKMSVRNYHYSLRYNPEERSSQDITTKLTYNIHCTYIVIALGYALKIPNVVLRILLEHSFLNHVIVHLRL